ncbi:MAG TPA: hypothetical protein VF657_08540 [Actinoplanes sp.]
MTEKEEPYGSPEENPPTAARKPFARPLRRLWWSPATATALDVIAEVLGGGEHGDLAQLARVAGHLLRLADALQRAPGERS